MSDPGVECAVHKLVADVAILAQGRVLLVRYRDTSKYDRQRGWFLPDDYLAHLEDPAEAARRIAAEQAGLDLAIVGLADLESFGNGKWHLVFHYVAELASVPKVKPGENVEAAEWFGLDDLPERHQMAHEGWALDVLQKMLGDATVP
jgi:ADP-ribose pyrophosphatase YjhB (NUDIX family)